MKTKGAGSVNDVIEELLNGENLKISRFDVQFEGFSDLPKISDSPKMSDSPQNSEGRSSVCTFLSSNRQSVWIAMLFVSFFIFAV